VAAAVAILAGGLGALTAVVFFGAGRKTAIPFGPFMALGAVVGVLWGERLLEAWR
jgi:prepilin signal peptidase PulO-like enzyme (type II secretory pathway)